MDSRYLWKEEEKNQEINEIKNNNIILDEDEISDEKQEKVSSDELSKKRVEVKDKMPLGIDVFREKQNLVRNGRYRYLDSKGRAHDAARLTPSSKYMAPVLDKLKEVDNKLSGQFDPGAIEAVRKSFIDAIIACENYLDNRNPWTDEGKARKRMVRDFYAQLKQESVQLSERAQELENTGKEIEAGKTWLDILRDVRTDEYKNGENGVKISMGGAGTSEVYIIQKNGVKTFFKEKEEIESVSFSKLIDRKKNELEKNSREYAKSSADKDTITASLEKNRQRAKLLDGVAYLIKKKFGISESDVGDFLRSPEGMNVILHRIVKSAQNTKYKDDFAKAYSDHKAMAKTLNDMKESLKKMPEDDPERSELEKNIQMQIDLIMSESDITFIGKGLESISKKLLLPKVATGSAKIRLGDELAKRNVATSRMAKMLGLEGIVATSKLSTVEVNGKTMTGIMMEEAKGPDAYDLIEASVNKNEPIKYTSDSFRELLSLQVFDIICGQTDRHIKNYKVQFEEKEGTRIFKSIKGIDNDMAFGELSYSEIKGSGLRGYAAIKNIEIDGNMAIPFMDHKLAMNIKALKPEILEYQMADLLSKKERKALISRIKGVQKIIDKQLAYEAKCRSKNIAYVSRFVRAKENAQDGDKAWHKAWDDAYETYRMHVEGQIRKNAEKIAGFMKNTTYLVIQAV